MPAGFAVAVDLVVLTVLSVVVGFAALLVLTVVADFAAVLGFTTLTGLALGFATLGVAVDLEVVFATGFATGFVTRGRKLDFFVVFTFDTFVLDTVVFGVGFLATTTFLFCNVAPCATEAPPIFTPKNNVAIIINCNRFVFIVISLSVKYLNAHRQV